MTVRVNVRRLGHKTWSHHLFKRIGYPFHAIITNLIVDPKTVMLLWSSSFSCLCCFQHSLVFGHMLSYISHLNYQSCMLSCSLLYYYNEKHCILVATTLFHPIYLLMSGLLLLLLEKMNELYQCASCSLFMQYLFIAACGNLEKQRFYALSISQDIDVKLLRWCIIIAQCFSLSNHAVLDCSRYQAKKMIILWVVGVLR